MNFSSQFPAVGVFETQHSSQDLRLLKKIIIRNGSIKVIHHPNESPLFGSS